MTSLKKKSAVILFFLLVGFLGYSQIQSASQISVDLSENTIINENQNETNYEIVVKDLSNYLDQIKVQKKVIFYIPVYTRLTYNKISHPHLKQFNDLKSLVKDTAIKYDFEFVDGTKIYHNRQNPLDVFNYNLPTHFNIEGYEILAQELLPHIFE